LKTIGPVNHARLAIMISGRGSNMKAIMAAAHTPDYPARVTLVISDNLHAPGLETASRAGIPTMAIPRKDFDNKQAHEAAIIRALAQAHTQLIALAGYMRILSPHFVGFYEKRILNIHPSLLPAYKGLDTHERALADGVHEHGCSVHYVDASLDGGEVIGQARVPVCENDTPETLAARVLEQEHQLYPAMVAKIAQHIVEEHINGTQHWKGS